MGYMSYIRLSPLKGVSRTIFSQSKTSPFYMRKYSTKVDYKPIRSVLVANRGNFSILCVFAINLFCYMHFVYIIGLVSCFMNYL